MPAATADRLYERMLRETLRRELVDEFADEDAQRAAGRATVESFTSPADWLDQERPNIIHPVDGFVPFELRDYQREVLDAWQERARIIVKSRQLGFSQAFAAEAYFKARYCPPRPILVVSRNEDSAFEFMGYLRRFCRDGELTKDREGALAFHNGSRIKAEAATRSAGRSFAAADVYLDEFAHAPWQQEIWQAVKPTISTGGTITVFSSPKGQVNMFARLYGGMLGREQWWRRKYPWSVLWDQEWADAEQAAMTTQQFAEEYGADFVESGGALFRDEDVTACFRQAWTPSPRAQLLCTIDPAGKGKDATVIQVWDLAAKPVRLLRQERWIKGPYERFYQTCLKLREEYGIREWWLDATGGFDTMVEELESRVGRGRVQPFIFTARSKEEALTALVHDIERHAISFDDEQLRTELMLYQRDDTDLVTDTVMAAAIMAKARAGHHIQRSI